MMSAQNLSIRPVCWMAPGEEDRDHEEPGEDVARPERLARSRERIGHHDRQDHVDRRADEHTRQRDQERATKGGRVEDEAIGLRGEVDREDRHAATGGGSARRERERQDVQDREEAKHRQKR